MFFHPLLATLITGAARLMLATTERLIKDAGLDWAFCDTDSMAIANYNNLNNEEFLNKAKQIYEWFTPLNPYTDKTPLLKLEDENFSLDAKRELEPLYCHAISSKRYALFNLDENNNIAPRKVSAHGLGHLLAPYEGKSDICGVAKWQEDVWVEIINACIEQRLPDYTKLNNFNIPTVSRYGATTPELLKWYKNYNSDKKYREQVKPFNFLLSLQGNFEHKHLKPVAPYSKGMNKVYKTSFDRITGETINKNNLKTYAEAIAQYHLHPESKFNNGDYTDIGITERRHIKADVINYIGKEANKWEEQFFIGYNKNAQIEYGIGSEQKEKMLEAIINATNKYGLKDIAKKAKVTDRYISKIINNESNVSEKTLLKVYSAVQILDDISDNYEEMRDTANKLIKEKNISIRSIAKKIDVDASNLSKVLGGKRRNREYLDIVYNYLLKS